VVETKAVLLNWGGDRVEPRTLEFPREAQPGTEFSHGGVRWQIIGLAPKAAQYGLPALSAFACVIAPVPFATRRTIVPVPSDRLREFVDRTQSLDSAISVREKVESAVENGSDIALTTDEKRVAVDVLRFWIDEAGVDAPRRAR
jgi:hypothetical protein